MNIKPSTNFELKFYDEDGSFCAECEEEVEYDARYCHYCGEHLEIYETATITIKHFDTKNEMDEYLKVNQILELDVISIKEDYLFYLLGTLKNKETKK